jgi:hypothetical protein
MLFLLQGRVIIHYYAYTIYYVQKFLSHRPQIGVEHYKARLVQFD